MKRLLAALLALVLLSPAAAHAAPTALAAPKMLARQSVDPTCSFNVGLAKSLGIAVCGYEPKQVADTVPGTAGNPSPQVITVQGCTGCISTGSGGGGGGTASYSGVSASAYGQTGTASSFTGIAGFDYLNSNIDALTVAPFGGNSSGTGYPAAYGQPGVLVVQGGLQGGAIGISGNLGGPYSGTASGQTATAGSFMGSGGIYNSAAPTLTNTQFAPTQLDSSGNTKVNIATIPGAGQQTMANSLPVTISSNQSPVPIQNSVSATGTGTLTALGTLGTAGAGTVIVPTNGAAAVGFSLLGTWTATVAFYGTTDGVNYIALGCTNVNALYGTGGGGGNLSTAVTGQWVCSTSGYQDISWVATAYTSGTVPISYSFYPHPIGTFLTYGSGNVASSITLSDANTPGVQLGTANFNNNFNGTSWQRQLVCPNHASISIAATAETLQLVGLVSGKNIYVCSVSLTLSGTTTPTAGFVYGTGTNCGTGQTAITGTYTAVSGTSMFIKDGGNLGLLWSGLTSNELCIITGGTAPTVQGVITYDQY